jgi:hypothetical protein
MDELAEIGIACFVRSQSASRAQKQALWGGTSSFCAHAMK